MAQIKVSEKALGHLSRGLYRSPASALRELVSNAWDANATTVRINTNYPNFFQLAVEDNGDGFARLDFKKLMEGGIGNSYKRTRPYEPIHGRPLIGRLGIGMLGIAQICGSFAVTSKTKDGEGFRARITLYDLLRERLDKEDKKLVKRNDNPPNEENVFSGPVREVDVGEYEFEEFDPKAIKGKGTLILADDLHPTFVKTFAESRGYEKFIEPSLEWGKCLKTLSGIHSLQEVGDYWRLLWELATACPLPYLNGFALPKGLIRGEQQRLESYDFKLLVDSIDLRKPVYLRKSKHGFSTWKIGPYSELVYGRRLAFHGYLAVQEGEQLKPDELRGLLIRIKDVAVGYYDPSLLDYRYNEGPRFKWVTGEIFVREGLDDALNIDRDSFNKFHPHFRAIQLHIHTLLRAKIFPESYKQIDVRSTARKKERESQRKEHLKDVIATAVAVPVRLKIVKTVEGEIKQASAEVTPGQNKLTVSIPSEIRTRKSNQLLASSILAIFEVALQEKSKEKQRDKFSELLLRLLSKW